MHALLVLWVFFFLLIQHADLVIITVITWAPYCITIYRSSRLACKFSNIKSGADFVESHAKLRDKQSLEVTSRNDVKLRLL